MSFSYNPLKHIAIVDDPPTPGYDTDLNPDTYVIYCHGCGNSRNRLPKDAPLTAAFDIMREHVRKSHARTAEDFADWSVY
jgi:hypothetical protein